MITDTTKAIKSLLGDASWSIVDENLETLQVYTEGVEAPTESAIKNEIKRLAELEKSKPVQKQAILNRLGLTADEAALLLS